MNDNKYWDEILEKARRKDERTRQKAKQIAQDIFEEEQARLISHPCIYEMAWPPEEEVVLCSSTPDFELHGF